ncbi:MAG: pesticidal protein Cry7Aa [Candidatus Aenigmatarchaeota archaeon]|nr:MAG: pesticidal protein Cry7Aa [Candidatus Aenigmarchaeota archaeon]
MERYLLLQPGPEKWESQAVLNPAVYREGKTVHLFYRAVGFNRSMIGYAKITDGEIERFRKPALKPEYGWEKEGTEDPRLVKIGNLFYLLYVAYDGRNARTALAISRKLPKFEKRGIVSPQLTVKEALGLVKDERYAKAWRKQVKHHGLRSIIWDKDAVLFPEKIKGRFWMLHRIEPDIQLVRFKRWQELKERDFWEEYLRELDQHTLMKPAFRWESEKIGAGCPPIKTRKGWLLIYHGAGKAGRIKRGIERIKRGFGFKGWDLVYRAGIALLDRKRPEKVVARLEKPFFGPKYKWEKRGDVANVVFPTGAFIRKGVLEIYYGCADSRIGVLKAPLEEVFERLGV